MAWTLHLRTNMHERSYLVENSLDVHTKQMRGKMWHFGTVRFRARNNIVAIPKYRIFLHWHNLFFSDAIISFNICLLYRICMPYNQPINSRYSKTVCFPTYSWVPCWQEDHECWWQVNVLVSNANEDTPSCTAYFPIQDWVQNRIVVLHILGDRTRVNISGFRKLRLLNWNQQMQVRSIF